MNLVWQINEIIINKNIFITCIHSLMKIITEFHTGILVT